MQIFYLWVCSVFYLGAVGRFWQQNSYSTLRNWPNLDFQTLSCLKSQMMCPLKHRHSKNKWVQSTLHLLLQKSQCNIMGLIMVKAKKKALDQNPGDRLLSLSKFNTRAFNLMTDLRRSVTSSTTMCSSLSEPCRFISPILSSSADMLGKDIKKK